jgi:hypothetical protein
VISTLVVKDRHIHAVVVLPYFAGCALDPRPFDREVVFPADTAADVVLVVFGVESVVSGCF